ncbi:MAG: hypothetical protein A2Y10_06205 [Planctomycetes bacterium GWF2_41_51]|nr:MAG: hypothetical protein A2Y10_06205 [Planctomycetes bacterium GWF2_41_51]HBG26479.1 hypothetical protein [Phycisphaerales bacterium]
MYNKNINMSHFDITSDIFQLYYPVSTYNGRSPFQLLLASEFANKKNEIFDRKRHLYYTFSYVVGGSGKLTIAGQDFYPRPHSMFILHKNMAHLGVTNPEDPWHKIYFDVDGWLVEELLRAYSLDDSYFFKDIYLEPYFRKMLGLAKNHANDVHEKAVIIFHKILIKLQNQSSYLNTYSTNVKKTITYIKEYLEKDISMQDISGNVGLSPEHLTRIFKKEVGTTPYLYYLKKRIHLAQVLLKNTNMSVKEIASRLGYKDEFYFSNCFKKYTGVSPLNYRKNSENNSF